jgi:hypothetical protein
MKDDIIRMARDAGMLTWLNPPEDVTERFERFAALVRADEREACAQIAWNMEPDENGPIETAIRARGQS